MPEISCPYPGIQTWENEQGALVVRLHYLADPDKGLGKKTHVPEINIDLTPWALGEYEAMADKGLYRQEYEIDFEATQGARVFFYDHAATMITSKEMEVDGIWPIPRHWTRWYALDPHPRVPHAHLWCAVDPWGDRWYYREYWPSKIYGKPGNPPEDDNRVLIKQYVQIVQFLESAENPENQGQMEQIYRRVIDYAARGFGIGQFDNERPNQNEENYQETYERLSREVGKGEWRMHFVDCKKDHDAGFAVVNEGLKPREVEIDDQWTKRSEIHVVIDKCPELEYQLRTNRYPKLTAVQADKMDPISDPIQKRRHMTDNCLAAGTMVICREGEREIQDVEAGSEVLTRFGWCKVLRAWMSSPKARIISVRLSNGRILRGTPEHRIYSAGHWVTLDSLRYGDTMESCEQNVLFSMAERTAGIRNPKSDPCGSTTARFLKAMTSTIVTAIRSIMTSPILNANRKVNTTPIMDGNAKGNHGRLKLWQKYALWLHGGINPRQGESGTARIRSMFGARLLGAMSNVFNAVLDLRARISLAPISFAAINARLPLDMLPGLTMSSASAMYVEANLQSIGIPEKEHVTANAVRVVDSWPEGTASVYDLEVENDHEYYANGVLVHNCRYIEMDKPRYIKQEYVPSTRRPLHKGVSY